jgi:hypothetical protein
MKRGVIYHRNLISAMFVVEMDGGGYSVFECFNINSFSVGDQISGALYQPGTAIILNGSTLKTDSVIIRKVNLSLTDAMDYADLN